MKTTAYIFVLTLISTFSSAQKIEEYYDWMWRKTDPAGARYYALIEKKGDLWIRKDYFLRESKLQMRGAYTDTSYKIPQGEFQYYHANGNMQSIGKYENGKRHGLWLSFHANGMMSDSATYEMGNLVGTRMMWYSNGYPMDSAVFQPDGSGTLVSWFDNGSPGAAGRYAPGYKQHGKWRYFHRNGQTSSLEVYDQGKLVSRQYYAEDGTAISDTTNTDRDAYFPGGPEAWKKYLLKKVYFPTQWKLANADQAVVTVDWYIDEEGNIKEPVVSAPLHPDFDRIALKAFEKAPKWIPTKSHNRYIRTYHRQPITFAQE